MLAYGSSPAAASSRARQDDIPEMPPGADAAGAQLGPPPSLVGQLGRYGLAAATATLAFALRLSLSGEVSTPFTLFYPAVMVAALVGGVGPGLLATALSLGFGSLILNGGRPFGARDGAALALFIVVCLFITFVAGSYRAARDRLFQLERDRAVRETEERFRAFFENAGVGATLLDPSGRFVQVNERYCRITGYPREELVGMTPADLVAPADRERLWHELRPLLQGRVATMIAERRYVRKDGSVVWVRVTATLIRDASLRPALSAALIEDVTERKRTEDALRENRELLNNIIDSSPSMIFARDLDDRLILLNRRLADYYGVERARALGTTPHDLLPKERADAHVATNLRAMDSDTPLQLEETMLLEGALRWFMVTKFRLRDTRGQVFGIGGVVTDVTEQRQAEQAVREADRRKSEFLAILSHELRNPIAAIRNALHVLEHAPADRERLASATRVANRQVRHLTTLIDDLLDVTRISQGKIALRQSAADACELVRRTCDDHAAAFADGAIALSLDLPPDPVWIHADATRIAQVVGNLLHNAAKFTPAGGKVAVGLRAADGRAELRVRDTGAGIEPGLIDRVFEPFVQGRDASEPGRHGGLGLGLALVRSLVELHGGTVRASSEGASRGTEFVVALPLEPAPPRTADERPGIRARRNLSVLVIEDNADVGETLVQVLELAGHRPSLAMDGRSGIARAAELRPDVVLCDIGLPDVDGYEVARALRGDPALRDVRLLALSGFAQPDDKRRATEAGFDGHISKPASLDELEAMIAGSV